MRAVVIGTSFAIMSATAWAQQPATQNPPPPKMFTSSSEVVALIAKAKNERKSDQANFVQPIIRLAPYTTNLEYRVAGLNANAAVHEHEAELFYVVEGSGTLVTGGTLRDEKRTNAENLQGSGIDGGTRQKVSKGDFLIVPENTPHWFGEIDGALVLVSFHVPRGGTTAAR
jgi:mannose-6-phosphate isomerase-like protein (cupin superfamily)